MKVEAHDISYTYAAGAQSQTALADVSLSIDSGSRVAVLGAPGSGKSTFLQVLAGLLPPGTGQVLYDETRLPLREIRRRVALALQQPEEQFWAASVREEVAFAPRNLGVARADAYAQADNALSAFGLNPAQYGHRSPFSLSGGEKRRVALASALVTAPQLVLLDEPLAGLDQYAAADVWQSVESQLDALKATCVVITHDLDFAMHWADQAVVFFAGRVVFQGCAAHLLNLDWKAVHLEAPQLVELANCLAQLQWAITPRDAASAKLMAAVIARLLRGNRA